MILLYRPTFHVLYGHQADKLKLLIVSASQSQFVLKSISFDFIAPI